MFEWVENNWASCISGLSARVNCPYLSRSLSHFLQLLRRFEPASDGCRVNLNTNLYTASSHPIHLLSQQDYMVLECMNNFAARQIVRAQAVR